MTTFRVSSCPFSRHFSRTAAYDDLKTIAYLSTRCSSAYRQSVTRMRRSVTKFSNFAPGSCFCRLKVTVSRICFFIGVTHCVYLLYTPCRVSGVLGRRWRPNEGLVYLTAVVTDGR